MPILHIHINQKIATYNRRDGEIVCDNADYSIKFTFDNEWAGVDPKTARFVWGGEYFDREFTGDTCSVPKIMDADSVKVGVFTDGDLHTTTDAVIGCRPSILGASKVPSKNTGKGYTTQAQEAAREAESAADRAGAAAARAEAASEALNTPGTIYATDDGEGNVTLRGDAVEMVDSEARAGVAELRAQLNNLDVSGEIPAFDLVTLGLPNIVINGEAVTLETDTTEMLAAIQAGAARFHINVEYNGAAFNNIVCTMHDVSGGLCSSSFEVYGTPMMVTLAITEGNISATALVLAKDDGEETAEPPATSIDMTAFDSEGKIVETYADGTSKTTTLEYDDSGNPVKITDSDGNVTTLTW